MRTKQKGGASRPFSVSLVSCLEEEDEDDDDQNQCEQTATDVHESPLLSVSFLTVFPGLEIL
jgi:hypothetical protein